ncbi:MAG: TetR/AcrR family transcriptional regulator C-terminal domain-containing protein [Clostridia bacterium]|nr:TetR/AcrR family transcriptional regulator C-terminal domain-containing protein [Clostridia bacterium]
MDRRQRKTREAIFKAFIFLLSKKNFNNITVGEIIEIADVGRATFYAHFETKDFLLKDLCGELFDHIFSPETGNSNGNIFHCEGQDSVFLHLFKHIKKNDNNIGKLLASKNNELFLEYFQRGIKGLVIKNLADFQHKKPELLPENFWINHISASFINTLKWWIEQELQQPPELITEYFLQSI